MQLREEDALGLSEVAKIRADTDRSMALRAPEAVAYGLADRVITRREARAYRLDAA